MLKGLFVGMVLVAGLTRAQGWEVGAVGGYGYSPSSTIKAPAGSASAGFNNGAAMGAFGGNDTEEHWSGEARYLYRYSDLNLSSGSTSVDFAAHTHIITGDILGHLRRRSARIRPFVANHGKSRSCAIPNPRGPVRDLPSPPTVMAEHNITGFGSALHLGRRSRR